jgi:hypothetical protein
MEKYILLKTASATAKKNDLQLFKNSYNNKYALLDINILNAEGVPESFKKYAIVEFTKGMFTDCMILFYNILEAETITAKVYFKIYTIDTEEKRSIYKIFQAVKVEYCHNKIDACSGQKTVLNEFIKAIGTNYAPETITI